MTHLISFTKTAVAKNINCKDADKRQKNKSDLEYERHHKDSPNRNVHVCCSQSCRVLTGVWMKIYNAFTACV